MLGLLLICIALVALWGSSGRWDLGPVRRLLHRARERTRSVRATRSH